MDRSSATTLLTQKYRELATDAEFTSQQTTDAYNAALDMSLRQLGYEEAALSTADVPQPDVLKYIALMTYYTLDRFATLLAIRFNVKLGQGALEASRIQAFEAVKTLKSMAAVELAQYGVNVGGAQSFEMGRISLDYLEPSTLSEF